MEQIAVEWTEWIVHHLLFWENDDKRKGRILRAFHHFGSNALLVLILVSHTIYPAFWLQTIILMFCVLVWIQHILTRGCVLSKVEQKMIGDESSFIDPFLEIAHIETDNASKPGILILGSTLGVALLGLEWISRVHHYIIPVLVRFARSQSPVSVSIQGTPLL